MKDNFDKALSFVLSWEGGYSNDPDDPGGETNFGISKRSYPNENIKDMTKERASEL
jgi:lysozyme family protein